MEKVYDYIVVGSRKKTITVVWPRLNMTGAGFLVKGKWNTKG
jgi:hypothetical protein